jgi:hypothetical protein
MRPILTDTLRKRLQQLFWIYLTNNFVIRNVNDVRMIDFASKCVLAPITMDNYFRVLDFRETNRISEYRDKLAKKEVGFFTECDGKMIASIWATINNAQAPVVVRTYMRLMPQEALIHDIVTGEHFRGMRVGPFMVGRIASILLNEYRVRRIIIDVNVRNSPSLRMMDNAGLKMERQMLYISAFGRLVLQKTLRR